jgi:hypothetical protein
VLVDPSPDAATNDRVMALMPPERQVELRALVSPNRAGIDTERRYDDMRPIRDLPDRPSMLLLAGQIIGQPPWFPSAEAPRLYQEGMRALAVTSPQAVVRVAEQSSHDIAEQQPAAVAEAIGEVIQRAAAPTPGRNGPGVDSGSRRFADWVGAADDGSASAAGRAERAGGSTSAPSPSVTKRCRVCALSDPSGIVDRCDSGGRPKWADLAHRMRRPIPLVTGSHQSTCDRCRRPRF